MKSTSHIRQIIKEDNPAVATIIREVMPEFGAVGCGFSSEDAEIDSMFKAYSGPGASFFVIEQNGNVLGCGGLAPLAGGDGTVCELRKMYFLPELRGSGLGSQLLQRILQAARDAVFLRCYLETLGSMAGARHLYQKHGFKVIDKPMGNTGHSGCNNYMVLDL